MTTHIQIPLDPELAQVYDRASNENQRKLQALISLWLRDMDSSNAVSLSSLMDEISNKAAARGLTPEILESLLNDEE
jgi:hypothetical protein